MNVAEAKATDGSDHLDSQLVQNRARWRHAAREENDLQIHVLRFSSSDEQQIIYFLMLSDSQIYLRKH